MEQLERLKLRTGAKDDEDMILLDLLESAKNIIMEIRYPLSDFPDELENRYKGLQIDIAIDLYNKQGAEGETSHSENGISRTYGAENVSSDLIARITPKAEVL